jgi:hypothetical protein
VATGQHSLVVEKKHFKSDEAYLTILLFRQFFTKMKHSFSKFWTGDILLSVDVWCIYMNFTEFADQNCCCANHGATYLQTVTQSKEKVRVLCFMLFLYFTLVLYSSPTKIAVRVTFVYYLIRAHIFLICYLKQ